MKAFKTSNFTRPSIGVDGDISTGELVRLMDYLVTVNSDLGRVFGILQGNVTLGTAVTAKPGENFFGQWRTVADTGAINTEFSVTHNLSAEGISIIPDNYWITKISKGGVIYKDPAGTAWTTSTVYFKCSVANAAVNIFLMR